MGKCVIFCAADFDCLLQPLEESDFLIAADGGLRHTEKLKRTPNLILGDFDSLGYVPAGANVFPVEKDDTDAMLAVRQGLRLGFREFWLYGGMDGPRLDHTLANFQTLAFLAQNDAFGYLIGTKYLATVVKDGSLFFPAGKSGTVSLFCLGPDAEGITLEGLHYPLREGSLTSSFPLGVSNHFTGADARISVEKGSLLVLWDRENGLPQRSNLSV